MWIRLDSFANCRMHEGNVRLELGIGGAADRSPAFVYRKVG